LKYTIKLCTSKQHGFHRGESRCVRPARNRIHKLGPSHRPAPNSARIPRQSLSEKRRARRQKLENRQKTLEERHKKIEKILEGRRQDWEARKERAVTFDAQIQDYVWKWEQLTKRQEMFPLEAKHIPFPFLRTPGDSTMTTETVKGHIERFSKFWQSQLTPVEERASTRLMKSWRYDKLCEVVLPMVEANHKFDVAHSAYCVFTHVADIVQEEFMVGEAKRTRSAKESRENEARRAAIMKQEEAEQKVREEREKMEQETERRARSWEYATEAEITRCRQRDVRTWGQGLWTIARALTRFLSQKKEFLEIKFSDAQPLTAEVIPWPVLVRPLNLKLGDIDWHMVKEFFACVEHQISAEEYKGLVWETYLMFRADRWRAKQRFVSVKDEPMRELLNNTVNTVSQAMESLRKGKGKFTEIS